MKNNIGTDYANIDVSGNILKEVSEKLPNMFVALNELVKNSYDACASTVEITYLSEDNSLIIRDDGEGMSRENIDTLLTISKSDKNYGSTSKCNRIIQGSKGLGFLSTFKFGNSVSWITTKDNTQLSFELNLENLINQKNLSDSKIEITRLDLDPPAQQGTLIKIKMDQNNVDEFYKTFVTDRSTRDRLLNSISDDSFKIKLNYDNTNISESTQSNVINEKFKNLLIYNVKYNNKTSKLKFLHGSTELFEIEHVVPSDRFTIDLDLEIYHLQGNTVDNADPMFIYKSSTSRILAPAVYINNNIFNSQELFDPGITRAIRNDIVLAQIAGVIKIYSTDSELEFNAERTKLLENSFSEDLIQILKNLNILIQTNGSRRKHFLHDFSKIINQTPSNMPPLDGENYIDNIDQIMLYSINQKFHFKHLITYNISNDEIEFYFANKSLGKYKLPKLNKDMIHPVIIKLKKEYMVFNLPYTNQQINLRSLIEDAKNSKKKDIKEEVKILINNSPVVNDVLPSINESMELPITYSYLDEQTGVSTAVLRLQFVNPLSKKLNTNNENSYLISNLASDKYTISFNHYVNKLIDKLNEIYDSNNIDEKNDILIAASIRVIFDISIQTIIKSSIKSNLIKSTNSLEDNVNKTISLLKDKTIREKIAENTGMTFEIINSLVLQGGGNQITKDYGNAVRKSNLGSHSSTTHLSRLDILDIAKKLSSFLIFVNELINNPEVNSLL